jgi:tryptophan synthase beta chain
MDNKYFKAENGYFGEFGGQFIPEILHEVIAELTKGFNEIKDDPKFWKLFHDEINNFSVRPTTLMFAKNLTSHFKKAKIYIKREDLNHTGAHKFNNVLGQGLLAKKLGKKRLIAETGAGQHGLATATIAAYLNMQCVIYMGAEDVERQRPNVFWMEKLGAKVVPVTSGGKILKDAINEAMKDWLQNISDTHYLLGTVCGPHPFPEMVATFQKIIGDETRKQILQKENKLPNAVYACVGGGSNAAGIFQGFIDDPDVELIGVEAGGRGGQRIGDHAVRLAFNSASVGIAQGYKSYFIQNNDGQLQETHSISAGLDYVGISPIMCNLRDSKRARFEAATDKEVMAAHSLTVKKEGIIPALESTHAFAQCFKEIKNFSKEDTVIINQSGRGDKDIFTIADAYNDDSWKKFIKDKAEQYN